MQTPMGYEFETTLVTDFQIASHFGEKAVRDTYAEVFDGWKENIVWMTEMYIALNWEVWRLYEINEKLAWVYQELYKRLYEYICDR